MTTNHNDSRPDVQPVITNSAENTGAFRRLDARSIETGNFLWSIADILRGHFRRGEYESVILPFTVLRRLDSVLAPTKQTVIEKNNTTMVRELDNPYNVLCKTSGYRFYNTSPFTFERLLNDAQGIGANLRAYIGGFSPNMREVLQKFNFEHTITRLETAGILFLICRKFAEADLHPSRVSNAQMGSVFEYLLFKFNEALDENPGEHYTPREVVDLCTELLMRPIVKAAEQSGGGLPSIHTIYDPCCGTGGMLVAGFDRIKGTPTRKGINPYADVFLFGQELNPQTWAVCKSDMYIKLPDNDSAENIAFGSVLSADGHADQRFEFILSNPPYGADWRGDEDAVRREYAGGGRFSPGLPRISDGQLLFLLHMVSRMRSPDEGGGRIAVVMNGSPLFTGDAGSGESEIRRFLLENDLVEAIIALPEQMFYNTGISTYILVLANKRDPKRAGKVQLIDGSGFWKQMRKSQGQKRRELSEADINAILALYDAFTEDGDESIILPTTAFGYRKITVERPLRLNFAVTPERLERLERESAFVGLAESKKKDERDKQADIEQGQAEQAAIRAALLTLSPPAPLPLFVPHRGRGENSSRVGADTGSGNDIQPVLPPPSVRDEQGEGGGGGEGRKWLSRAEFLADLDKAIAATRIPTLPGKLDLDTGERLKLSAGVKKAILNALSERDATAEICRDKDGNPEPDTDLRDSESVPLGEDVNAYVQREVLPHVPDAWIDEKKRDAKDGGVGIVGYEINFNRYFYEYTPPRPLSAIDAEIRGLEAEILSLLREVAG